MDTFVELSSSTASLCVVGDGSVFAQTVANKLDQHGEFEVSWYAPETFLGLAELPQHPVLLLIDGEAELSSTVGALLRRSYPVALLVSNTASLLAKYAGQMTDVLLWPAPAELLNARINILQRLQDTHAQLDAMRHSLAWHKARVEREHQLVEHIFQNALSRNYLDFKHVHTYLTPVSKFNGDLCLISPGPLGNIYMLMADFTGHGLAPATGALPLSQAFFAMADRGVSVAEMVTEFNFRMNRLLPNDMFCAAFLLELSANGERVTYWNGGMPPALLFDQQGIILKRLPPAHMALGVIDDDEFDSRVGTFRAPPNSSIALFTDGVTELLGHQQKFLGSDALEVLLSKYPRTADFSRLVEELEHFRGETPLHDDLSLAILTCLPTGLGEATPEPDQFGLPFSFDVLLKPEHLSTIDPVGHILSALSQLPYLRRHRTTIYLFLAEAFNNALEHGLLGLDSTLKHDPDGFAEYYQLRQERLLELTEGEIRIHVTFDTKLKQLSVQVSDSGTGVALLDDNHDLTQSYGRGLELLRQMTTDLHWDQTTRTVSFKYSF
ncbi:ATP-binding SpoIIE family protein phosphatase [Pseudidiomarina gelatinasegens]|uniref:ATP-binding SpoIIE family protein phosphatase n=1 Tax=Pseudidiomarina gelatinasegens TaxID=2487740 RepID=UPI003A981A33